MTLQHKGQYLRQKAMNMKYNSTESIQPYLSEIPDPRQQGKIRYSLPEILYLTLCAVVSDCTEWSEIADFGKDKLTWLRKSYGYENGIPSHDTINRTISLIHPESFIEVFRLWAKKKIQMPEGLLINLDGKKLRGSATKSEQQTPRAEGGKSAVILLEAWSTSLGLCLDIVEVDEKENEIKAIPKVLEALDLEGCVVSIDAIGCQKEITAAICSQGADYVIGVKRNQPKLYNAIEAAFEKHALLPSATTETRDVKYDKDHGRAEERICMTLSSDLIEDDGIKESWQSLKTIIQIQSKRYVLATKQESTEVRYYISSACCAATIMSGYVRGHWGIENSLHWSLDVYWGEDASRKRAANAPANFGIILRAAHNLIKTIDDALSIQRRLKKCGRSDEYREMVLRA